MIRRDVPFVAEEKVCLLPRDLRTRCRFSGQQCIECLRSRAARQGHGESVSLGYSVLCGVEINFSGRAGKCDCVAEDVNAAFHYRSPVAECALRLAGERRSAK